MRKRYTDLKNLVIVNSISSARNVLFTLPKKLSLFLFKVYVPTETILVHLPPCLQKNLLAYIIFC